MFTFLLVTVPRWWREWQWRRFNGKQQRVLRGKKF
jgi:hypothetical protein